MTNIVNQATIAQILGVTVRTLSSWMDPDETPNPIPFNRIYRDGKAGGGTAGKAEFNVPDCVQWLVQLRLDQYRNSLTPNNLEAEKFKEQQARARLMTLKADQAEGLLVNAAEVKAKMVSHITRATRVLDQLPHKIAMAVTDGMDYEQKKAEAEKIKAQALLELSTDVSISPDPGEIEPDLPEELEPVEDKPKRRGRPRKAQSC